MQHHGHTTSRHDTHSHLKLPAFPVIVAVSIVMHIYVRFLTGKTIKLDVTGKDNVWMLKAMICHKEGKSQYKMA
jgi:hypothetical protein